MTKNEMTKKMLDICFKVQGVGLQLGAGHMLRAAAAATVRARKAFRRGKPCRDIAGNARNYGWNICSNPSGIP